MNPFSINRAVSRRGAAKGHALSHAGRWLLNRRHFLRCGGTGLGAIALLSLLAEEQLLGADKSPIRPQ